MFGQSYKFASDEAIGDGSFAICMKCINNYSNQEYGVKIVRSDHNVDDEIEALKLCRGHSNIVNFVEVIKEEKFTYIVTEWLAGVELFEYAIEKELSEDEVRGIFIKITNAVRHMHLQHVIHCDLKLENIKFTDTDPKNSNLKILDFGFAYRRTEYQGRRDKVCCTLEYAAPEILLNQPINESSDLWSVGVILYTLLCGHSPFLLSDERYNGTDQIAKRIHKAQYIKTSNRYDKLSQNAKSLIGRLLQLAPEKRISLNQISNHGWLDPDDYRSAVEVSESVGRFGRSMPKPVRKSRLRIPPTVVPKPVYGDLYEPEIEPVSDPEIDPVLEPEIDHEQDMVSDKVTESELVHHAVEHEPDLVNDLDSELDHEQETEADQVTDVEPDSDPEQELETEQVTDLEQELEIEQDLEHETILVADLDQESETEQDLESEVVDDMEHESESASEPVPEPEEHNGQQKNVYEPEPVSTSNRIDGVDSPCNIGTLTNVVSIDLSESERADNDIGSGSVGVDYAAHASLPKVDNVDNVDQADNTVKTGNPAVYGKAFEHTTDAEIEATKDAANDLNGIYMANTIPENVENLNNNNEKYIETSNMEEFVNSSMDMIIQQSTYETMQENVIVASKTNGDMSAMTMDLYAYIDNDTSIDPYEFEDDEEDDFYGFASNDPSLLRNIGRDIDFRKIFAQRRIIKYDEPDRSEYQEQVPAWNDVSRKRKYSESSESDDPSYSTRSRSKVNSSIVPKRLRRRRAEIS